MMWSICFDVAAKLKSASGEKETSGKNVFFFKKKTHPIDAVVTTSRKKIPDKKVFLVSA